MSCYSVFIQFRLGVFPSNICTLHLTKFNAIWILKKNLHDVRVQKVDNIWEKMVFVHPYPTSLCPKISAILTYCICPKISALLVAKEELSHWYRLQLCYVGSGDEEDVFHLFFNCPFAQTVGMHWPWTSLMIKTFTPNWRMEGFMLRIVFSYRCS